MQDLRLEKPKTTLIDDYMDESWGFHIKNGSQFASPDEASCIVKRTLEKLGRSRKIQIEVSKNPFSKNQLGRELTKSHLTNLVRYFLCRVQYSELGQGIPQIIFSYLDLRQTI